MKNKKTIAIAAICLAAFMAGFFVIDTPLAKAQTGNCTIGNNDWCSVWSVTQWYRDYLRGYTVGPANWQVDGQVRKDTNILSFRENWSLTKVSRVWKNRADGGSTNTWDQTRQADLFVDSLGTIVGNAVSIYDHAGYIGTNSNPVGLYGAIQWGANGEPLNSKTFAYYPTEWTVSGHFCTSTNTCP